MLTTVMLVTVLAVHPIASAQKTKPKAAAAAQEGDRDTLVTANYLVDGLIKQVAPSVVQIVVTSYGPSEETPEEPGVRSDGAARSGRVSSSIMRATS